MTKQELLAQYSWKYDGDWSSVAKALSDNEEPGHEIITDKFITVFDEDYPESLRRLRYPPWVLFYRGDLSLLNYSAITIVGSRKMNAYGNRQPNYPHRFSPTASCWYRGLPKGWMRSCTAPRWERRERRSE